MHKNPNPNGEHEFPPKIHAGWPPEAAETGRRRPGSGRLTTRKQVAAGRPQTGWPEEGGGGGRTQKQMAGRFEAA